MRRHLPKVIATVVVSVLVYGCNTPTQSSQISLAPFEFHRQAAATPELAARSLFRGVATESPSDFVQHLLLGVCDGSIDTLQKFAESLHTTKFHHDGDSFTFYELRELRRSIIWKKPVRIVATAPFEPEDEKVRALELEMLSTYWGKRFMSVDVAGEGYDGREYRTRVVVAQGDAGWYAMPRCRSAQNFYKIADAMLIEAAGKDDQPRK